MSETMYTTGEAARILGVHPKTVYKWCINGRIAAHRTSPIGEWRITRTTLVEYARQNGIPLQEPNSDDK